MLIYAVLHVQINPFVSDRVGFTQALNCKGNVCDTKKREYKGG